MKCKCFGCSNESHQGDFTGEFCNPCYHYITTGNVGPTDSFLERINTLYDDVELYITQLAAIRDLFPAPAPGDELENSWMAAVAEPEAVFDYVQANVEDLREKAWKYDDLCK